MQIACHSSSVSQPVKAPRNTLPSTEEESLLIREILNGQTELFSELVQPHIRMLSRIVKTSVRNDFASDDVIQETLIKVFTRLEQFRFDARFRTWLIQIAINESRQWHRRNSHSRLVALEQASDTAMQIVDNGASPFDSYKRKEAADSLSSAIASLPLKYQAVVQLREFKHFSIADTARTLKLSIPAVKTRHRRARLMMRRELHSHMLNGGKS
jgi:RNA polymerase sigma-70 factor (ECF subfamily)